MAQIQFVATSPQDLKNEITADVKVILDDFLKNFKPVQPAEYLTRQQVAKMFGVDLSTVHNWSKSGKLKPLGIGSRVYFLRTDIEACLIPLNQ
ncbi:helix-turn-helix domain-containing protein [Flavobacterium plurextorum]|uniref:DNA-binding protein n=1 Tax=Flavobacterium plurextorum TaxID=1114867 RepID=A0ABX4CVQ9_9FLAO|nr:MULTISPECIES: helix-turn-helix domain-containing protein [Flavobacterium]OXB08876.1 DNA-binding protein [Flavobacterium plurextorum]UUW10443.1 helix-turn-helix domain-containing protein [Flavobacterium plurextorum]